MFDYYDVNDAANEGPHFNIYFDLLDKDQYQLSLKSVVLYGFLRNQYSLSLYTTNVKKVNTYVDAEGKIYCIADQRLIAHILGVNRKTVMRAMDELEAANLICRKRDKTLGSPNRIYVAKFRSRVDMAKLFHTDPRKMDTTMSQKRTQLCPKMGQ